MKKKILFITGSINQTQQMHKISRELPDYDCWFSQIFTDSAVLKTLIKKTSLVDSTVVAGQFKEKSEKYLRDHNLPNDYEGIKNQYELVVYCSDMIMAKKFRNTKTIWVQEGMIDKLTGWGTMVRRLNLPGWYAGNTALNGSSNACDIYCTASEGYKDLIVSRGADPSKILITGMPNYDNNREFLYNDFPHRDYVMVATTDMRETYRREDRPAFIKKTVEIANGRQLLFKLHPNEKFDRAEAEIKQYAPPGTLVFQSGNTNHMVANCCELITQYSTVVYIGISLGKKVHSYFDLEELKRLTPIQNNGTSAINIAQVCRDFAEFNGPKESFLKNYSFTPVPATEKEEIYA
ncbi:MAG: hypothetical protein JST19_17970 [Bacteroidetes bacterium]|nr:hypothetical protein [Bacteroidota bacterium]